MKLGISNIAKLVEEEHISLHRIAQIAGQSINATETGTFIHRVAELRALRHHRDEILAGKRYVELQVQMSDGSRGEIDLVTVRRNFHHIHDYNQLISDESSIRAGQEILNIGLPQSGAAISPELGTTVICSLT